jgi:hypothetical protein
MNNHYWEGRISVAKTSKLMRGLKMVHYRICSSKINTSEPNLTTYSWNFYYLSQLH